MAWLNEIYTQHQYMKWFYAKTEGQVADFFTKPFTNSAIYERLRTAVGITKSVMEFVRVARELFKRTLFLVSVDADRAPPPVGTMATVLTIRCRKWHTD